MNCTALGAHPPPTVPPAKGSPGWIAVFAVLSVYFVVMYVWFLKIRPYSVRIQKRSRIFLALSAISGLFGIGTVCISEYLGRSSVPCTFYFAVIFLSVPMTGGPMIIRLFIFYKETMNSMKALVASEVEVGKQNRREPRPSIIQKAAKATAVLQANYSFSSSNPIVVATYIAYLLPFVITVIVIELVDEVYKSHCYGCTLGVVEVGALIVSGGLVILVIFFGSVVLWRYEDPLGLKTEPIWALLGAGAFVGIAWLILIINSAYYEQFGMVIWQALYITGVTSFFSVQTLLQILISKRIIKVSRSVDDITLKDVLDNQETHSLFKKYMITEWAVDSVIFLENYLEWKSQQATMPDGYLRSEAEAIYNRFFGPKAPLPLNISVQNAKALHESFTALSIGTPLNKNCFDAVYAEITGLLNSDSLPRFMAKHGDEVRRLLLVMGTGSRGTFVPGIASGNLGKTSAIKSKKSNMSGSQALTTISEISP